MLYNRFLYLIGYSGRDNVFKDEIPVLFLFDEKDAEPGVGRLV